MKLVFESLHERDLATQIARYLAERGWLTCPPEQGPKERPRGMAARLGVSSRHLCESLSDECCPPFHCARGATGRIRWLVSNVRLEAFIARNKPLATTNGNGHKEHSRLTPAKMDTPCRIS